MSVKKACRPYKIRPYHVPVTKIHIFTLQELRSLEAELYDKQREQRQTEERLKQREKELAEREIDLLERELNIMILQQVFNCLICYHNNLEKLMKLCVSQIRGGSFK